MGLHASARYLIDIDRPEDVLAVNRCFTSEWPRYVLGGGSNMVFVGDFPGLLLRNAIGGLRFEPLAKDQTLVTVGGGVNWHMLVMETVARGWSGLENLALIPGTCGAAPIQNIGAYGVEQSDLFVGCGAVSLRTGKMHWFDKEACRFDYRDSVFKNNWAGEYLIASVQYRLSAHNRPQLEYPALREALERKGIQTPSAREVMQTVIEVRRSKLPDPEELGNTGSFFKNPIVSNAYLEDLRKEYPDVKYFPLPYGRVKIPAAWLIERCGWKGYREGNVGCYHRQPLVIVHFGGGDGWEILRFAVRVARSVYQRFGIELEPEVRIVGATDWATMWQERTAIPQ